MVELETVVIDSLRPEQLTEQEFLERLRELFKIDVIYYPGAKIRNI